MKTEDTKALRKRELNQARSKPNTVDQPVRTVRTFVHRDSFFNIPLPPDQHHIGDVATCR